MLEVLFLCIVGSYGFKFHRHLIFNKLDKMHENLWEFRFISDKKYPAHSTEVIHYCDEHATIFSSHIPKRSPYIYMEEL